MANINIVGPQAAADGASVAARAGKTGEQIIQQLHGRYYEATKRGLMFGGSITGQVTTVGLATTYTGLCLSNPFTSSVDLVINKVGYAFLVAFAAAASVGLMTGYNATTNVTHTTPVTVRGQRFTGVTSSGSGLLDSAATLPTAPTLNQIFGAGLTGAITTIPGIYSGVVDMEGALILPPGAYAALYTSTVSGAAAGAFSFSWEEVPSA